MVLFNKKGQTTYLMFRISELVLALIVLVAMLFYVRSVASNIEFERSYMARDLGLLADTMYASPGEISVPYSTKVDPKRVLLIFTTGANGTFIADFDNSRVFVFANESSTEQPRTYYFGRDSKVQFFPQKRLSGDFILKKNQDGFLLGKDAATIEAQENGK